MGKRNLAIVGTHEDYFADIYDENFGGDPSYVSGCASPEDAAVSYFRNVFENSNGLIRSAAVAVWRVNERPDNRAVFDVIADVTPCESPDAGNGEYDVSIDVKERR